MPTSELQSLHIAQVVRPATGGIRRHVSMLLAGYSADRFRMTLFAPRDFEPEVDAPDRVDLPIAARTALFADLLCAFRLARRIARGVDVVHAHGLRAGLIAGLAARITRVPFIFTAHNLPPRLGSLSRAALNLTARGAFRVVTVSSAVREQLFNAGVLTDRTVVIPNGVAPAVYAPSVLHNELLADWHLNDDGPIVLAVGRLSPEKGFDLLIEAFSRVCAQLPLAHLLIAGDGPLRADLERRAAAASDRIRLLGQVDYLPVLYAVSDVVVVPSRMEGQGIVALEAMASAKPVVATRVGGLCETIEDGETGLLVHPEDSAALAGGIIRMLKSPNMRREFGEAGRARVRRDYSADTMYAKIGQLYDDAAGSRQGPSRGGKR